MPKTQRSPELKWLPIASTFITRAAYDMEQQRLFIQMQSASQPARNGTWYYDKVPNPLWLLLQITSSRGESVGAFFNQRIAPNFAASKMQAP